MYLHVGIFKNFIQFIDANNIVYLTTYLIYAWFIYLSV